MGRDFHPSGISITAGVGKCAYHCRYCQLARYRPVSCAIERVIAVVDRFREYADKQNHEFGVSQWLGYSFDVTLDEYEQQHALYQRLDQEITGILLGGLPHWPDDVLKRWFLERKKRGLEFVTASFLGCDATHDYWNNKKGNFAFQMNALNLAGQIGLAISQRAFLIRSTMPQMEQLLDYLEAIDGQLEFRVAYPLFYSGLARKYDNERVTMELLDNQPNRVRAIYRQDKDNWKSEKEWIEHFRDQEDMAIEDGYLSLELTDVNIGRIEAMTCEEIIADLTQRTRAAYACIPARSELVERWSDAINEKIYMFPWDMECRWVDRFLESNPVRFERELTHFGR